MKVHDAIIGAAVLALGVSVSAYAHTLKPPRHLDYGPGFFPFLIGIGLCLVGSGLVFQGIRNGRNQALFVLPEWVHSGKAALRFWILPAAIVFYLVAVTPLGFLLTAILILTTIFIINGVAIGRSLGLAVLLSVIVNIAFASVLHVPLAWGVLTPVSRWLIW